MFRLSAGRLVRLLVVAAIVYMLGNFLAKFLFSKPDLATPEKDLLSQRIRVVDTKMPVMVKTTSKSEFLHADTIPTHSMSIEQRQELVSYIGRHLDIKYEITNNLIEEYKYIGKIILTNKGDRPIPLGPWKMYFYHPVDIENARKDEVGAELANRMMFVSHVNGGLFKLQPTALFTPIKPGDSLQIPYQGGRWICSKTDVYPNWYVDANGVRPAPIESTADETLAFVHDFDTEPRWKRNQNDNHNPLTPRDRFLWNEIQDLGRAGGYVVPTPLQVNSVNNKGSSEVLKVNPDTWVVVAGSRLLQQEASFLTEKTGMKEVRFKPKSRYIGLVEGPVELLGADVVKNEAYSLTVEPDTESITITSPTPTGAFNGVQTLLSLLSNDSGLPIVKIVDAPRYGFRGVMLDVCRNFRSVKEVLELIDIMASYKLNKFHFHLTDDEGWRIEIPNLPELTQIGGRRCHDLKEAECILPYNGAGLSGHADGFYTTAEYREILKFAEKRHVQVIPEIDVPGHAHAAIKAMEARYRKLKHAGRMMQAEEFLISDPEDQSQYHSVQQFKDNVINVCMESTYTFIEAVITALVAAHKDIQPLKTLHIGGDEVPGDALLDSPKCKELMIRKHFTSQVNLTHYFTERVFKMAADKHGLLIQGWEDVFYKHQVLQKYRGVGETTVNVWANVWTYKNVFRAADLSNNDYKIVLGPATHLYLDHPHEPDPEERGLFWATRFVNEYSVFGFMPDSYYDNIEIDSFGHQISKEEICGVDPQKCPKFKKPNNIVGIEAHLWSETVRTREHMHTMLFPRLLAVAERAWHRANWELETSSPHRRRRAKNADWNRFANTLGYHELPRLDKRGVQYRIPLPGALIHEGRLKLNAAIPGLPFVASWDGGHTWSKLVTDTRVTKDTLIATSSTDGRRRSRSIKVNIG